MGTNFLIYPIWKKKKGHISLAFQRKVTLNHHPFALSRRCNPSSLLHSIMKDFLFKNNLNNSIHIIYLK